MRWIASLTLLLALAGAALAAGTDDDYLAIYNQILLADTLQQGDHPDLAAAKYRDALDALQQFRQAHPAWNTSVVDFRLQYLSEKVKALAQYISVTNAAPAVAAATNRATPEQIQAALQDQIKSLTAANAELSQKLKEALSVQPAAVAPAELAKEREKTLALQKERDVLNASLEQLKAAKAAKPPAEPPPPKPESPKVAKELADLKARSEADAKTARTQIADLKQQLADAQKSQTGMAAELSTLKARAATETSAAETVKQLSADKDRLKKDLASSSKELADTTGELNKLKAHQTDQAAISAENLKELAADKERLKKDLASSNKELSDTTAELNKLKAQTAEQTAFADGLKQANAEKDRLKKDLASSNKELADATAALNKAKAQMAEQTASAENLKQANAEKDRLTKDLASSNKELNDTTAALNKAKAQLAEQTASAKSDSDTAKKLKQVEQERDSLAKQVAALSRPVPASSGNNASAETAQLRARLAVLEATAVPYTAAELAILNATPATAAAPPPALVPAASHTAHSVRDLPPGVGPLMREAQDAVRMRDYATAEKKFQEVLLQAEDNVYVLVNLGNTQFALGHLDDCDKNVHRALALDPADPGALYLLGILRLRQDKLDEALDALSRSAAINATNSMTQNYLGLALAGKGLRPASETALRKSLELDQDNPEAHFNLATVYASETPPSLALARWHYQKALDLGHPKSGDLEKMLAVGN